MDNKMYFIFSLLFYNYISSRRYPCMLHVPTLYHPLRGQICFRVCLLWRQIDGYLYFLHNFINQQRSSYQNVKERQKQLTVLLTIVSNKEWYSKQKYLRGCRLQARVNLSQTVWIEDKKKEFGCAPLEICKNILK